MIKNFRKIKGVKRFFDKHFDEVFYFLKKRRFVKAYNLIWSQLWVRDLDGGKFDWIFRRFPQLAPYPKEIEIEITTRCYMKCIMCEHTHWKDENYRSQDMNFEQFKSIINQFPHLRYINVTGEGTGFLNKDFFKMLDYLNKKNVNTMFVENFDLFDEEKIKKIIDLDVERIEVSLDAATEDTYKNIRIGAKWDRVMENLKKMREMKIKHKTPFPYIFFRLIAMKNNVHEIPALARLIGELDINLGKITDFQIVGLLSFPEIEHLNVENISEQIIKEADSIAKEMNINLIWSHTSNNCSSNNFCAKWLQPYIMIDGSAILDCALMMENNRSQLKRTSLGNLFNQNFREIWDSPRYQRIRKGINKINGPVPKLCEGCRGYDTKQREKLFGIMSDNKN
ncbi:MAG: hypothetical protein A2528_02890 [Candidatus Staskawiczbacteria bacterium RIFOXYD2_FULL_37_9]|uniref:Radical SAM core domain-containing protein n=1 Tax=Candidatus Staskawiczbacteria bacterium RIFOXYB1_FULL_37_44 TaxID=1802223 RepID=A0A1G2IYC3_9BACT|nr:MAG: hypothetical protein A2358_01475 [Candidatus Staskawiczbacteria bacterium RIFOXYB1_FULL_37_44]OGZ83377.1 MAG: hypothetical protein A2416_02210 [Candidatus Staskawiczbacteria bacterium RIFOXYC1_FULL_37_52]OGZ86926.1 MAG: hypothetical protein A2444_01080 [Candidatus Staskawiczbacteria bacterium RIFOXYC2_FULL_37_19]OGZ88780.1 MAG: hypothetical protein A2581_03150 [Candidatus Staskawiczbacteria bacterium RIFOXYD1_FULL_37_110]OGZ94743.1 MAG: hypothetical protein A2528_02890 [Candidatus Stask